MTSAAMPDAEADPGEKNELKEYMALPQIEYKTPPTGGWRTASSFRI